MLSFGFGLGIAVLLLKKVHFLSAPLESGDRHVSHDFLSCFFLAGCQLSQPCSGWLAPNLDWLSWQQLG